MPDFDLTCWYLNMRRVLELTRASGLAPLSSEIRAADKLGQDPLRKMSLLSILKDALLGWLQDHEVKPLGQMLATDRLREGDLFTHYGAFYCRGLPDAQRRGYLKGIVPEIHAELDYGRRSRVVHIPYDPSHLTSTSASAMLSGRRRVFTLAVTSSVRPDAITAMPYVIASMVSSEIAADRFWWGNYREVFVDNIDSFERVRETAGGHIPYDDIEVLRTIPEKRIKEAFASIIGEPVVPGDWGGERSDLFTTHVRLQGRRTSAAFVFKGPSSFRPLTMAALGRRQDQIERLFSEPADLLVVQHCHKIEKSVRSVMRAYAQRIGDPRLFCLINGFDTLRILRAYDKL
ncbi:MAG TPA: hypothetical protein VM537_20020 [Anaerolineae bacterium]|nr:hypothetical protein [Anaerolineae bacterium]